MEGFSSKESHAGVFFSSLHPPVPAAFWLPRAMRTAGASPIMIVVPPFKRSVGMACAMEAEKDEEAEEIEEVV